MRIYGFPRDVQRSPGSSIELEDVVIEVDEESLVALRDFAQQALDDLHRLGTEYSRVHFQDASPAWRSPWPDIILVKQRDHAAEGCE
jgi:hypothetical protein